MVTIIFVFALPLEAKAFRTGADLVEVPDDAIVGWGSGSLQLSPRGRGLLDVDSSALRAALVRASSAWQAAECTDVALDVSGLTDQVAEPGDGANVVEWIEAGWEDRGFDPALPATTLVQYEEIDGLWTIVEADVFVNAEHHELRFAEPSVESGALWVDAVLTHELGHVLGLLHTCEAGGAEGAPICGSEHQASATMSPEYHPAQAMPDEDAIAGLCFLYPSDGKGKGDAGTCSGDACGDGGIGLTPDDGEEDAGSDGCDTGVSSVECDAGAPRGRLNVGDQCTEPAQCRGGHCLTGVERNPICTQACGTDQPACPSGWGCRSVADERVCVPSDDDDGCSAVRGIGARSTRETWTGTAAFSTFLLLVRFSRQRRRNRRESA